MKAFSLIRAQPWYRAEAFAAGLSAAGYEVHREAPTKVNPGDVLLIWNRYNWHHDLASKFETQGGTVLVAENGYLGIGGTSPKFDVHPKGPLPHHYYALAIGGHNGQGTWPSGGPERWEALGIELKPWRIDGKHVLICPNRSFGIPGRVMPPDWGERTKERLSKETGRPIVLRPHPGNDEPERKLEQDLAGAHSVFIWSSGSGVKALAEGIPVFCESPYWVMKGAAASGSIQSPILPDRLPHFQRMAWAQWSLREIEKGDAFNCLLRAAGEAKIAGCA